MRFGLSARANAPFEEIECRRRQEPIHRKDGGCADKRELVEGVLDGKPHGRQVDLMEATCSC